MIKYPSLFSPGKIGTIQTKNRVVMPPMGTSLSTMTGEMSNNIIEYYKARAKGGAGLIIVEVSEIDYVNGSSALNSVRVDTARSIPQMRRLTDGVHVYGTKIFAQLHHGGNQAASFFNDGNPLISPSGVKSKPIPDTPRALTTEEVKEYVGKYIFAANMVKMAHFDGVEIHGAHGYLVHQFFSEHTNKRTDEYGGSFENRMRFATEIIKGIKEACGQGFPVSIRIDADEFIPGGYPLEEGVRIAKAMEKAGADIISCSMGTYESLPAGVDTASFKQGWRVYMAEAVKKAVNVPVITVGALRDPEFAEGLIKNRRADFVALGRQHISDPEWCNKALNGREKEIRKCISCMTCIYNVLGAGPVCCAINARAGHEAEYPNPVKNGNGRNVVVVGGGPAGIEAARIAAVRGFKVVLFEKGDALGGQLQLAKEAIDQEAIGSFIDYGTYELARLGVDVRLNTEVTADIVRKEQPYAVFVATGGKAFIPNVPGITRASVITAEDYLAGKVDLSNQAIAVIGGGITGSETAVLAASKGSKACLVEMLENICIDIFPDSRAEIMDSIEKYKVDVFTNSMLKEVTENGILVEDTATGESREIKADKVVIAIGVKPVNEIYTELLGEIENVFVLGDAMRQGKIVDAVRTGHIRALELE